MAPDWASQRDVHSGPRFNPHGDVPPQRKDGSMNRPVPRTLAHSGQKVNNGLDAGAHTIVTLNIQVSSFELRQRERACSLEGGV